MKKFFIFIFVFTVYFENIFSNEFQDNLKIKFQDVLLVIHYNHPYYSSIPFIKELYSSVFSNIIFYGEASHSEVNTVKTEIGHYFLPVVSHVLKNYPGFYGYIFLQDDCLMNFWNYLRLDKDKIWFMTIGSTFNFLNTSFYEQTPPWHFAWDWGLKALKKAFLILPDEPLNQYKQSHGDQAIGHMCDMFYLPGKLAKKAIPLCDIFQNVFCEIAVPTMLSCLDNTYNWEKLNVLWSMSCEHSFNFYNIDYDWIHPLKFSSDNFKEFAKQQIEKYLEENND